MKLKNIAALIIVIVLSFSFASCGVNYDIKYSEATDENIEALKNSLEKDAEEEDYGVKLTAGIKVLGYQVKMTAYLTKREDKIGFSAKVTLIDDIESVTHEAYYKEGFFYYVENISNKERNVYKQELDSSQLTEIFSYYERLISAYGFDNFQEFEEAGIKIMYGKSASANIIKIFMEKDTLQEMSGMEFNDDFYLNAYYAFDNKGNLLGVKSEIKGKVYFGKTPVGLVMEGSVELVPYLQKISYPSYLKDAVEELPEWMTGSTPSYPY